MAGSISFDSNFNRTLDLSPKTDDGIKTTVYYLKCSSYIHYSYVYVQSL